MFWLWRCLSGNDNALVVSWLCFGGGGIRGGAFVMVFFLWLCLDNGKYVVILSSYMLILPNNTCFFFM